MLCKKWTTVQKRLYTVELQSSCEQRTDVLHLLSVQPTCSATSERINTGRRFMAVYLPIDCDTATVETPWQHWLTIRLTTSRQPEKTFMEYQLNCNCKMHNPYKHVLVKQTLLPRLHSLIRNYKLTCLPDWLSYHRRDVQSIHHGPVSVKLASCWHCLLLVNPGSTIRLKS
jgi:hypothetical protein